MAFNFKEYYKFIGKSKFYITLGWIFLILGIFIFCCSINTLINWNLKKKDYIKKYVYSDFGTLYYESNDKKVYIKNVYNLDNENIKINIPNNETILMYINKYNINEGIYCDLDNPKVQSIINPKTDMLVYIFLITTGLSFILINKETGKEKVRIKSVGPFYIFLFLSGIAVIIFQLYNTINYFNLKMQNNVTNATVYSGIYKKSSQQKNGIYKLVSYYYVDGEKYIYINDTFEGVILDDKLGDTFELYYDKNNPNRVIKKENAINNSYWFVGLIIISISFPMIFLRKNIDRLLEKEYNTKTM